jgi:hypothetical protein
MRVEEKPRPVRCGNRSGDEMGNSDGILDDERLLLPGQRRVEFVSGPPCTSTARRLASIRGWTSTGTSSGVEPISSNQKRYSSTRSKASR